MGYQVFTTPTVINPRHGVALFKTANQSIPDSVTTELSGWTETDDTDGYFNNAVDPTRITIPSGFGGIYVITAGTAWAANVAGFRSFVIIKNGVGAGIMHVQEQPPTFAGTQASQAAARFAALVPGDFLEMFVAQNSGVALNCLIGNADLENTYLTLYRATL